MPTMFATGGTVQVQSPEPAIRWEKQWQQSELLHNQHPGACRSPWKPREGRAPRDRQPAPCLLADPHPRQVLRSRARLAALPLVLPGPLTHTLRSTSAPLCGPSRPRTHRRRLEPCPAAGLAGLLVQAPLLGQGQWSAAVRAHRILSQPRRALPRLPASKPSSAQVGRDPGHPADSETPDSGALSLSPHSAARERAAASSHSDTVSRGLPPDPKF
ncbi:uncharacterized protein LOC117021980 isoform X2 [Rhinolophus ferrumequinum]|uniref:uncharacterized protein LOC117021980 isoform X2 n=1 Tax=Rhinolophus ferrumequinum TaxID=59479 RepID=UPI00140F5811|nr:uncharacterized protein LOC117021980 isoform X2 [Rhinolophus ferrumequinum]